MQIAYCQKCKTVIAAGPMASSPPPSHRVGDEKHTAEISEVSNVSRRPGEKLDAFLKRLVTERKVAGAPKK